MSSAFWTKCRAGEVSDTDQRRSRDCDRGISGDADHSSHDEPDLRDPANRIAIRHHLGRIVAVIEIVSPGNKDSRAALRDFVDKSIDFLRKGVHLLVVDLFPPTTIDPCGIHKAIWDEILLEDFTFPEGKNRILVSYDAGREKIAYIETIGVGDELPDMPIMLTSGLHVKVPLESTYQTASQLSPESYRHAVETGEFPDPGAE